MKKIESIQGRKIMSAYGGVGSIIETKDNGSLLIDFYDKWGCYSKKAIKNAIKITDERLQHHLHEHYGMSEDIELCKIPEVDSDSINVYYAKQKDLRETILSRYFPTWFFCPYCREIHRLEDWENLWNKKFNGDNRFKDNYPSCGNCSKSRGKDKISRRPLEQIRFCMASLDSGEIVDVPFKELFSFCRNGNVWDCNVRTPNDVKLTYHTTTSSDGLHSVFVKNENTGERISMAEIASAYVIIGNHAFKLVLRNQNNIYYPRVVQSLYIPWDKQYVKRILNKNNNGKSIEDIVDDINSSKDDDDPDVTSDIIQAIIDNNGLDFDAQVFHYVTTPSNYNKKGVNKNKDFYAIRYETLSTPLIKQFYAIHRLKETSVIPCFTRIGVYGEETKWWNVRERREERMQPKSVWTSSSPEDYIPAIESYGEGIMLEVSVDKIPENDREVFVHTLSHVIMKELEFQCGYPLSSLKEKIYCMDNSNRWGILIYTIGGSEGSYGGLISLLPSKFDATEAKLINIIENALERAEDCPNDPICESDGAHCFACTDIPEISCCMWNQKLDRRVLLKHCSSLNNSTAVPSGNTSSSDQSDTPSVTQPTSTTPSSQNSCNEEDVILA